MIIIAILFFTVVLSFVVTRYVIAYALARGVIDTPNERSSHTRPTPRGGGLAIVVAFFCALLLLWLFAGASLLPLYTLAGSAGLIAALGWLDDHRQLSALWRLVVHFIAAGWLLWLVQPEINHDVATDHRVVLWVAYVLLALYLVWLLNLFNFMDGIDGIASLEAVTVCLGLALLYWQVGPEDSSWTYPLLLAAATSGFLYWNFPPAKIFMGDTGSAFLGIVIGFFAIASLALDPNLFWSAQILLGVFIVDATYTLVRRALRGEQVHQPHRSHAYQHAARKHQSHRKVSLSVMAINALWLFPVAWTVAAGKLNGLVGLVIAYLPLVVLVWHYNAGKD